MKLHIIYNFKALCSKQYSSTTSNNISSTDFFLKFGWPSILLGSFFFYAKMGLAKSVCLFQKLLKVIFHKKIYQNFGKIHFHPSGANYISHFELLNYCILKAQCSKTGREKNNRIFKYLCFCVVMFKSMNFSKKLLLAPLVLLCSTNV